MAELTLLVNGVVFSLMMTKPLLFTVAFDEADREGIVFFGNYFRLAHRALEQFLPTIGISWPEWFTNSEWGVPLRHVEADYVRPLRPGDEYQVQIAVERMTTSSVEFSYVLQDYGGGVFARLKTVHVFVRRDDLGKVEIPRAVRERLTVGMTSR